MPTVATSRLSVSHDLLNVVAESVRAIRRSVPDLSGREHDLLYDFTQGKYLTGFLRLTEISRRCQDPHDASALPEGLRGFTLQDHPALTLDVLSAFDRETGINCEADLAQWAYMRQPTRTNKQRCVEALTRQLNVTRAAIDALHRHGSRT
jgi:hypothetical protein